MNITSPYPILWWLTAGLVLIDQLGPVILVGFFLGLLLFSIVCLAPFAAWLVWSAVAILL